jgi:signal transduction histidine kinase
MIETVLETAHDVASMSEKSQQIEQIIGHSVGDRSVDAGALVRRVANSYRQSYPAATITVDAPNSLSVRADSQLESAVENLVENAIEHNDAANPRVGITARADDGAATLTVSDDGPGVPETERAVITGDDDITQLTHASGIGLWLVRWITESCGGEISFADRTDGTDVSLELDTAE